MGMGGRVSNQEPHKQVHMQRVIPRFFYFMRVYYNLEGVLAPDPLRVVKLRKRKYSLENDLVRRGEYLFLGKCPSEPSP